MSSTTTPIPESPAPMQIITLSLISHTNVGKTTLARTLLRQDIGQVLDQAHVTEESEAYTLVEVEGACLRLFDTPGLGDSARLVKRLRNERNPIGWLLHQVWDRTRDRPLFCSQRAVRNIKLEADLVLYLVNASEDPRDAGYVPHEMELLDWMGKPVLVLLNQTDPTGAGDAAAITSWRQALSRWSFVRDVMSLDAFTRCWVQEDVLLERVVDLIPEEGRRAMRALCRAWQRRNLDVFEESIADLAAYLQRAAVDSEGLAGQGFGQTEKRRAMRALAERLDDATRELMDRLIARHGLEGRYRTVARESLEHDFDFPGTVAWTSGRATLIGAAMGGAAGGLAADVLVGGLSFGGGAVAGALLGVAGATGLRRGYQIVRGRGEPAVQWARDFLEQLARQSALRYLAVAHFGRGRGEWRDTGNPERWNSIIETALGMRSRDLDRGIAESRGADEDRARAERTMRVLFDTVLRDALKTVYPEAAHLL